VVKLPVVGSLLLVATALLVAGTAFGSADPSGRRSMTIGHTVDGRPITAVETGDFDSPDRLLVIGCIPGNECAGAAIAAHLAKIIPPRELDLWILRISIRTEPPPVREPTRTVSTSTATSSGTGGRSPASTTRARARCPSRRAAPPPSSS
jgi:hypothetical protein